MSTTITPSFDETRDLIADEVNLAHLTRVAAEVADAEVEVQLGVSGQVELFGHGKHLASYEVGSAGSQVQVFLPRGKGEQALPIINAVLEANGAPYRITDHGDSYQVTVKGRGMSHHFGAGTMLSAAIVDERWKLLQLEPYSA